MKKKTIVVIVTLVIALLITSAPVSATGCCECCEVGVGSPGYWKNHPDEWPVDLITIGNDTFTKAQAIALLDAPVKGDKSLTMFKAYVATFLNAEMGSCYCPGYYNLYDAEAWLIEFGVGTNVRGNTEAWMYSHGEQIYWDLDDYNNGLLCAPARD